LKREKILKNCLEKVKEISAEKVAFLRGFWYFPDLFALKFV